MNFKLSPIKQFTVFLAIYAVLALYFSYSLQVLLHLAGTLGFAILLYFFFSFFKKNPKDFYNTVITALIIFLILHYGTSIEAIYSSILATFIAVFSKFFLAYRGLPIFNPAVLGLLAVGLLDNFEVLSTGSFVSWWGASFQGKLSLVLVLLIAIWTAKKWRKLWIFFGFLVLQSTFVLIMDSPQILEGIFLDSTIYFFAGIMLLEPKTSPAQRKQQIIFTIIAFLAYNTLKSAHITNYELWAILAANLYNLSLRFKWGE